MDIALYIHYPFCISKCPYCDFNSHVNNQIDFDKFLAAYKAELIFYKNLCNDKLTLTSIFFGGGTPSLMPEKFFLDLMNFIQANFNFENNIEITLEANPSTIENTKIKFFYENGINRLSLGIQSFNDGLLKFLGRKHDAKTAINAIENTSKYFQNFSFDLIYGIYGQSLESWEKDIDKAIAFNSKHISLYQLTIEKGTEFYRRYRKGDLNILDDEIQADFYQLTYEKTKSQNFHRYEISNFAHKNYESKHNLTYWKYNDYIGIGAGAHSRISSVNDKKALVNYHNPEKWQNLNLKYGNAIFQKESLSLEIQAEEYLLMGLRLANGFNIKEYEYKFSKNIRNNNRVLELLDNNMLAIENGRLRIRQEYFNLADNIIAKIII